MRATLLESVLVATIVLLTGCGAEPSPEAEADDSPATTAAVEEPLFDEASRDAKCDLLTREDVSAATGVPASDLEENLGGCYYGWDAGDGRKEGMVYLASMRVHDSVDRARRDYAGRTQDVTAHEVGEAKEQVKDDLADRREEGEMTASEEAAASAMTDAMPEEGFSHQSLDDVGSEAAMDDRGSAYVRVGNVTIQISGKIDGEDRIDPAVAREVGRRIVANLEAL